jgi:hypothetical protein
MKRGGSLGNVPQKNLKELVKKLDIFRIVSHPQEYDPYY